MCLVRFSHGATYRARAAPLLDDVAQFRDTRARFRRDPIGIVDITQWDGRRPAADLGKPRHVSHDGGRDVDIAIPSTEEPSLQRDHCEKVVSPDPRRGEGHFTAVCRRGTGRAFDATRLAYLLGKLAARRVLDRALLDEEFLEPLAKAADRLARHHVIPKRAAVLLQPEGGGMNVDFGRTENERHRRVSRRPWQPGAIDMSCVPGAAAIRAHTSPLPHGHCPSL